MKRKTEKLLLIRRLAACCLDFFILVIGFDVYYTIVNRDNPMAYDRLFNGISELAGYFPYCLVYSFLLEWLTRGYTTGKFICRIRVKKTDGTLIGFPEVFFRWVGSFFDFMISLGLAAVISILLSSKDLRIGDRLARTIVSGV